MPANAPTLTVAFGISGSFTNVSADLLLEVEADLPDDGQTIFRWWPTISELEIRFVKLKRIFQAEAISPHVFHS